MSAGGSFRKVAIEKALATKLSDLGFKYHHAMGRIVRRRGDCIQVVGCNLHKTRSDVAVAPFMGAICEPIEKILKASSFSPGTLGAGPLTFLPRG